MESYVAAALTVFAVVGAFSVRWVVKRKQLKALAVETERLAKENARKEAARKKAEEDAKKIKCSIYFGSQTGMAEGFAKETAKAVSSFGFAPKVIDLEDFDPAELMTTKLALFYCATYGEGDAPDSAQEFCNWLKEEACSYEVKPTEGCLKELEFAVFGLGNTQYEHYNAMGKLIQKRMTELDGRAFYHYGEGDDDKDIEEDFETWQEGLLEIMAKRSGGNTQGVKSGEAFTDLKKSSSYVYKSKQFVSVICGRDQLAFICDV